MKNKNLAFRVALVLIFAASLVGCKSSNQETDSTDTSSNLPASSTTSPQVAVTPATPPPTPKPQWASVFLQCLDLHGKSKDKVVAAFGPPDRTGFFKEENRYEYDRKFLSRGYKLAFYFDTANNVKSNGIALDPPQNAREVWEALSRPNSTPLYYRVRDEFVKSYWRDRDANSPIEDVRLLIAINGSVKGREIQLDGRIAEPPLKAERVFSTETDGYVVGNLRPNPNSTWADAKIHLILSEFRDSGYFGEIYGEKHFLSEEQGDISDGGRDAFTQKTPSWQMINMANGLRTFSTGGGGVWHGAYKHLKIPEAAAGQTLRVDVKSDRHELRIELWKGTIKPNNHSWWEDHKQVAVSNGTGDQPETQVNPQLYWTVEPGIYTLFFANYASSGKIAHYNLSYRTSLK